MEAQKQEMGQGKEKETRRSLVKIKGRGSRGIVSLGQQSKSACWNVRREKENNLDSHVEKKRKETC